jgi:hypothetical protein
MKCSILFPFLLVLLFPIFLSAQTITGKLVDQNSNGLPGLYKYAPAKNIYKKINNSELKKLTFYRLYEKTIIPPVKPVSDSMFCR